MPISSRQHKILVSNITKKIKKSLLSEDIIESYTKNGFAIVKNIVPAQRINSLLENIFNLFCKYSADYQELKNMEKPWDTELFHKKLIEFRQKDPESFGAIYDSLKTSLTLTQLITDNKVVDFVAKFLKMWNSFGGSYVKFEHIQGHDLLEFDAYVHITSPIRRLVDLLNIMTLQSSLGLLEFNESSDAFYKKWTATPAFEYINQTMRSIRKVQNDCHLLKFCMVNEKEPEKLYDGFIFDKILRGDALFQYMVYLPESQNKIIKHHTAKE